MILMISKSYKIKEGKQIQVSRVFLVGGQGNQGRLLCAK
jgi:hypothetical protein